MYTSNVKESFQQDYHTVYIYHRGHLCLQSYWSDVGNVLRAHAPMNDTSSIEYVVRIVQRIARGTYFPHTFHGRYIAHFERHICMLYVSFFGVVWDSIGLSKITNLVHAILLVSQRKRTWCMRFYWSLKDNELGACDSIGLSKKTTLVYAIRLLAHKAIFSRCVVRLIMRGHFLSVFQFHGHTWEKYVPSNGHALGYTFQGCC
jgi:hypothetical protein